MHGIGKLVICLGDFDGCVEGILLGMVILFMEGSIVLSKDN